jgi:hypothetical protein
MPMLVRPVANSRTSTPDGAAGAPDRLDEKDTRFSVDEAVTAGFFKEKLKAAKARNKFSTAPILRVPWKP